MSTDTTSPSYRWAEGRFERLPELASELVALKPALIVALVTQASLAAKKATSSIPIVMVAVGDPIGSGLVRSLGRPGGNVTGNSSATVDVASKSLEILKEIASDRRRVAILWNPANAVFQSQLLKAAEAARRGACRRSVGWNMRRPAVSSAAGRTSMSCTAARPPTWSAS